MGRIRKRAEWIAASPEQNAGNVVFQQKYIYGDSFPAYDVLRISHTEAFELIRR